MGFAIRRTDPPWQNLVVEAVSTLAVKVAPTAVALCPGINEVSTGAHVTP